MKKILLLILSIIFLLPGTTKAQEFSLYGGKLGMTKGELDQVWIPLDSGEYAIKEAPIIGILPEFDLSGRLYKLSFSVPLPEEYPSQYASTALQKIIQDLWGKIPAVSLSTRTGRGDVTVTVVSKSLEEELIQSITVKLSTMLRP